MQTANRHHANRPGIMSASDRAKLAADVRNPHRVIDRTVNLAIVLVSVLAVVGGAL